MPSEDAISGLFESEEDKKALLTCLSLTFFLMLLEAFFDKDFSCPCDVELNATMINLIFAGPFLFVFALILYISVSKIDSRLQLVKIVLLSLLPPLVWIALVFLDGDYVACKKTYWNGLYVYDDQHHFKWCKPTESVPGKNDTELLALTLGFVAESQMTGFKILLGLGITAAAPVFLIILISMPVLCLVLKDDRRERNPELRT